MRKIRVFSGPANPCYISLDYRAQEGFIYRVARDGEEETPLLKKILAAKLGVGRDSRHRQRIRRQKNRARAGAHRQGRAAQAGIAKLRGLRPGKTDARRQRRIRQRALDLAFEITRLAQSQLTSP